MPEGPEVRRYADTLHATLAGKRLAALTARTRSARAYLETEGAGLIGRRVERVYSHGKNLIGEIEGGFFFYSHLLMWGRWLVPPEGAMAETDRRRERARIVTEDGSAAILLSAPIFEVGEGDPREKNPYLKALGPDVLPYPGEGPFAASCFQERLFRPENLSREIGAVLLDQTVAAGIGNYLRADILWDICLSPFRRVDALTDADIDALCRAAPALARRAYEKRSETVTDAEHERFSQDATLRYPGHSPEGRAFHYAFRRTNLPCLRCRTSIRQQRQWTRDTDEGKQERIIYFCPWCQREPRETEA